MNKSRVKKPVPPQDSAPLWEELTHATIVLKAISLMKDYSRDGKNPHVKDFFSLFNTETQTGARFRGALLQGLKDADLKEPWLDGERYYRHFYNPKSERNYKGDPHITAYSEAIRYFKLSEHYARRIAYFLSGGKEPDDQLYANAGYYLGLSLHFFTDLTQPMHAANFTNIFGDEGNAAPRPDLRHAGFEVYTDDAIRRGLFNDLPNLNDQDLAPFSENYVGNYIRETALQSKNIFDNNFKPVLDKKFEKFWGFDVLAQGFWKASEADPLINLTTKKAPYLVARYLTNWTFLAKLKPAWSSTKWYHILEPTKAPSNRDELDKYEVSDLSGGAGQWVQRYQRHGGFNQFFYLLFNADGTVCIGCRDGKKRLWLVAESYPQKWIGQTDRITRATRFRITNYDEKRVMIFESTQNEVVHVNTNKIHVNGIENWPGFFLRWSPAYDNNQWFILREMGDISKEDIAEIKNYYPDFGAYDWAGDSNTVPEWESNLNDAISIAVAGSRHKKPKKKAPVKKNRPSKTKAKSAAKKKIAKKAVPAAKPKKKRKVK